jgi:hypothetical protein
MIEDGVLYGSVQAKIAGVDFIRVELPEGGFGSITLRGNRRMTGATVGEPITLQFLDGSWTAEGSSYADRHLS